MKKANFETADAVRESHNLKNNVGVGVLDDPQLKHINKTMLNSAITLIALIITILFSYDEKLKCSNSKDFLLQTV